MKWFVFVLMVSACGKFATTPGVESLLSQEIVPFTPQAVSVDETSKIRSICDALALKKSQLPVLESSLHTFRYAEKPCLTGTINPTQELTAYIQGLMFKLVDTNAPFMFSNIETNDSGVMKDICANLNALQSPMQSQSSGPIWFTTLTSASECVSDPTQMCIQIERGTLVDSTNYKKTTKEIIKFKTSGEKVGFFTYRKFISSLTCTENNVLIRQATLK